MKPTIEVINANTEITKYQLTDKEQELLLSISNNETKDVLLKLIRGNQKYIDSQQQVIDEFESRKKYCRDFAAYVRKLKAYQNMSHRDAIRKAEKDLQHKKPATMY